MENTISEAEVAESAKIGEASGMGTPEFTPSEAPEEGTNAEKPETEPKKPESKADDKGESEEDEPEEDEAGEEGDEDEEDGEDDNRHSRAEKRPTRTVPQNPLTKREKVKDFWAAVDEIRDLADAIRGQKKESTQEVDEISAEAQKLAEELNVDSEDLAKILRKSVELASKNGKELPKDVQEKLKLLDTLEEKSRAGDEAAHFESEWRQVLPELSKQYPNAGESEKAEAKELLDKLAHSKEFHDKDLDYVLFKNRAQFDTLLKVAAKGKSGEVSKGLGQDDYESGEEDENLTDIDKMTPEIMKARERKSIDSRSSSHKDYKVIAPVR